MTPKVHIESCIVLSLPNILVHQISTELAALTKKVIDVWMSERRFRKIKQFQNMIQTSNLKPTTFSIGVPPRSFPPWWHHLPHPMI